MLLIQGGTVIDPIMGMSVQDLLILNGRIIKMAPNITEENINVSEYESDSNETLQVIHAEGLKIGPGLVDVHVHFRDPGFTYKEDILTGAESAAKGGFTSVVQMANTKPAVDSEETLSYVLDKGKQAPIRVFSCACITKSMAGQVMTDMKALKDAGAVGFTDDGVPILSGELVKEAMKKAADLNVPLSFHEENPEYIENNGINKGKASAYYGIGGSDRKAEISLVERDLELALETGAAFNVQHISAKESVELVRNAKKKEAERGLHNIHAEATPHHFSLTEEAAIKYGTLAKMNPPLRTEEDRKAIIQGLADGSIDLIATDHAPHSKEEKNRDITQAPSGIIGLETAFALAVTNLVRTGYLTLTQLFDRMSYAPSDLYHLPYGRIQEGSPADLIIFDDNRQTRFDHFVSKSQNTPFLGQELYGTINYTICNGQVVYQMK